MSANFLNTSGFCFGTDFHMYFAVAPPEPMPLPFPWAPHLVGAPHSWTSRTWRIANTVTTDAQPTLQCNWAMIMVPHLPFPPPGPPHPAAELAWIGAVITTSSAQPPLAVHGVTGQGQKLLTEIYGFYGLNVDCSDKPAVGISHDINPNSVKTSPTLGDYVAAILGAALRVLWAWVLGGVVKKVEGSGPNPVAKELETILMRILAKLGFTTVQTILSYLASNPVNAVINWITSKVQELVDSNVAPLLQ